MTDERREADQPEAPLVILWDIDGTIMRSAGVGLMAFDRAIVKVTGRSVAGVRLDLGGRTDPSIAVELLAAVGVDDRSLVPTILDELAIAYDDLHDELVARARVMPGVVTAIDALADRQARQTVVTGNIRSVADRKLTVAGVAHRLDLDVGAYGSDHEDRAELVRLALGRVGCSRPADRGKVWVIGDTPRDAACARDNGVRSVLVATGTYERGALHGLGAAAVLDDLSDVDALLRLIGA